MALCVFLIVLFLAHAGSQMMPGMGMPGMGGQQKRAQPYKKYHSRIMCQVCELTMKHIIREVKFAFMRNPKITEAEIFNLTDSTCNPFHDEGVWITQYDIVKKAPKLKLKLMVEDEKNEIGECERECESIAFSCMEILDDNNLEIVEYIWNHLGKLKRSVLTNAICPKPYCKREKSDIKKKSKMGKDRWLPLWDVEKRQMMQMVDAMPENVQMYDPSSMSMDEMMESMKEMYGDDLPEFDDDGNPIKKKKKKKKKKKSKKNKSKGEATIMDTISDGVNSVKSKVNEWLSPFWGDDGKYEL